MRLHPSDCFQPEGVEFLIRDSLKVVQVQVEVDHLLLVDVHLRPLLGDRRASPEMDRMEINHMLNRAGIPISLLAQVRTTPDRPHLEIVRHHPHP